MKKQISFTLDFLIMFSCFSGCASKKDKEPVEELREVVYTSTEIAVPEGYNASQMRFVGGGIALFNGADITVMDYSGIVKSETILELIENGNGYYSCFDIDPEGNCRALKVSADTGTDSGLSVVKFGKDGEITESINIAGGVFGNDGANADPEMLLVSDGHYYIQTEKAVYIFDSSGDFTFQTPETGENHNNEYMKSVFRLKNGKTAAFSVRLDSDFFAVIRVIDLAAKSADEYVIPIAGAGTDCLFAKGGEQDILMCTTIGAYDYSLSGESKKGLFNFLDYGINVGDLEDMTLLTDGGLICAMRGANGLISEFIRYTPAEEGDLGNRKILTLSAFNVDYWLQGYIASFNKTNPDYKIEVWSYKERDQEEALKKFNLDLMGGKTADIMVLNSFMPTDSYIRKGMFTDLSALMEADGNFNKEDYLPNAFAALERGGKLHQIFPMYIVSTIMAKESETIGTDWTLDGFAEYISSKPGSKYIIDDFTKADFIRRMVQVLYIDPVTGECKFDMDSFHKVLKIAERFPDESLGDNADYEFLDGLKNGDPIMHYSSLMRFRSGRTEEIMYFNEDIAFTGLPGADGSGSFFLPCARFAVSEKSENKEGAWEFIKYMLDNYNDIYEIYLPIKLSSLEELKQKSMEIPYYTDSDGNRVEKEYTVSNMQVRGIVIGDNTKEQADKVMDLIRSIKYVYPSNETISGIIDEEISAYLAGGKSAGDAAGIIENRINLYVREME